MRSKARQRGASAVFVAISMVASIAALGMALDLGRLYYTHRDLQLLADMAALDAARSAGGCMGKVDDPQGAAAGEAASSLQRNGGSLGYLTAGAVELGREATVGGVRTFVADNSTRADSVRVTLRRPLPAKLVPIFSSGPGGTMTVTAAANMRPIVSLDVAPALADFNSPVPGELLPALFGAPPNVQIVGPAGLLGATVTLGDLSAAANAASVEDFLDTQTTAPALLNAIANALSGTSDAAVKTTLSALASGGDTSQTVVPRQILGVPAGSTADDALVSVGSIVSGLADSANGDNLLNVTLPVTVPLLGQGTVGVTLLQLARPAVGPPIADAAGNAQTVANAAQGTITARINLRPILGNQVQLQVYGQVAAASAAVEQVQCSQRGRPNPSVVVDTRTSPLRFGIGDAVDLRSPEPGFVTIAKIAPNLEVQAKFNVDLGRETEQSLNFQGPFPAPSQSAGADITDLLESAIDNTDVQVRVVPENAIISSEVAAAVALLKPELDDAVRTLARGVVAPAAAALGASFGTATVTVRSVSVVQPQVYAR